MLHLYFDISNPWNRRFKSVFLRQGSLFFKHKFWEFEIFKTNHIISLTADLFVKGDHPRISFSIGLIGFWVQFQIYDERHNL